VANQLADLPDVGDLSAADAITAAVPDPVASDPPRPLLPTAPA